MISGRAMLQGRRRLRLDLVPVLFVLIAAASAAWSQVVISQVYSAGGNVYQRDYVELSNRGVDPVSLTGMSLQNASAGGSGTFSSNGVTSLSGTLAPGQFLLVGFSAAASGSALPSPFLTGNSATNLATASGKVALVSGETGLACNGAAAACSPAELASILDLVGYGTADFFEGAAAAPSGSTTTALFRASPPSAVRWSGMAVGSESTRAAVWKIVLETPMRHIVGEAYELFEEGLIDADDFRDFTFANSVRLHGGMNPKFFDGTAVEAEARKVLAEIGPLA